MKNAFPKRSHRRAGIGKTPNCPEVKLDNALDKEKEDVRWEQGKRDTSWSHVDAERNFSSS